MGGHSGCDLCFGDVDGVLVNVEPSKRLCKLAREGLGECVRLIVGK